MRENDGDLHPAALARRRKDNIKMISGLILAAAGLLAVFWLKEVYVGFAVSLVGTGLVPFEKITDVFRK